MKVKFHEFSGEVLEVYESNSKLRSILSRLEHGSKATPRTWFYENRKPAQILSPIEHKLDGIKQDLPDLYAWEISKKEKYLPQGESAPFSQRLERFDEYFQSIGAPSIVKDPLWQKAKQIALKQFGFNESGSPITGQQVVARGLSEDKYNTSSGFDKYGRRKDPKVIKAALDDLMSCIERRFPTTTGTRASMGKIKEKARFIFMGSMSVNIRGQRFQQPLQDFVRKRNLEFFLPWEGWDKTQIGISQKWRDSYLKVGADYTSMDHFFNLHHGLECFDVIKHYFHPKYWEELKVIIIYVFTMPILTSRGIVEQEHGMPSGSEWTNFLETVWNFIFSIYLELKYHWKFMCKMGIGDDQLWMLDISGKPESVIKYVTETIIKEFEYAGLPGNPDKQEVSFTHVGFLQRFLCNDWSGPDGTVRGAGVYSLIRNVTSQVFPEFYHNLRKEDLEYNELFALRVIMIAENCRLHPLFKWYVTEFIAKANPNILEFVRRKDAQIIDAELRAKKVANFIPTYNQEKLGQSILNFETFRLLREVA